MKLAQIIALLASLLLTACPAPKSPTATKKETSDLAQMIDANGEATIRLSLRNTIRELLIAENDYFKDTGHYGSLGELTEPRGNIKYLPVDFQDHQPAGRNDVSIRVSNDKLHIVITVIHGNMKCWTDELGNLKENPSAK